MASVFDKLNLRDQKSILVLNAPESFETELAALSGITVLRELSEANEVTFALAFATKQTEVDGISRAVAEKTKGDAQIWFAYPKGTSKKYQCDFNRDSGWAALGEAGFQAVRQVAIDEDWSALRFRRAAFIQRRH